MTRARVRRLEGGGRGGGSGSPSHTVDMNMRCQGRVVRAQVWETCSNTSFAEDSRDICLGDVLQ
eukprot:3880127-Pyramimonas_sp.AAC.1